MESAISSVKNASFLAGREGAKRLHAFSIVIGSIGVFVAGMSSGSYLTNAELYCGLRSECNELRFFAEAYFYGVPLAYFGLAAFVTLVLMDLAVIPLVRNKQAAATITSIISLVGALTSVYLIYQLCFNLKLICLWCISSAILWCLLSLAKAKLLSNPLSELVISRKYLWMMGLLPIIALGSAASISFLSPKIKHGHADNMQQLESFGVQNLVSHGALVVGTEKQPITLAIFSSLSCPACNYAVPRILTEAKLSRRVKVVYYHRILHGTQQELDWDATSVVAMDAGRFEEYINKLFDTPSAKRGTPAEFAVQQGLATNVSEYEKVARASRAPERVLEDDSIGKLVRIAVTPTFVAIEGNTIRSLDYEQAMLFLRTHR